MADEKAKKAAFKEGGKKGVDLDGVSATGGVMFFNLVSISINIIASYQ